MIIPLGDVGDLALMLRIESIAVESGVRDDVILQQPLEVLLTILAEQEGVDLGPQLLEGEVVGCEEGASRLGGVLKVVEEASLVETKFKGAELVRKKLDDFERLRWRQDDGVDTMDDTVRPELLDRHLARNLEGYDRKAGRTMLTAITRE